LGKKWAHVRNTEFFGRRHENVGDQKIRGYEKFTKWLEELGKERCTMLEKKK